MRREDGSGRGAAPFPCCRWVAGSEKRGPHPGGCRRKSWGFRACLTPRVAKAGLHSPGICCMCRAGGRPSRRFVGPSGVAGVCCAAVCHRVVVVGPVARRGSESWGSVPCVAPGRRGRYLSLRAQGLGVLPGSPPQCGRRVAVNCLAPAPASGGVRCSTTPPWSLVRPRAPRVWLAPLPGPSRTRYVGEEGQV